MKCPVCTTKKGKRNCLLTTTCICSACCGKARKKDICHACVYYQELTRDYSAIPFYRPQEMNNSFDLQKIANVIELAISTFDYNTTDIIQDDIPIRILESLLDVYYFKEPHEKSADVLYEKGFQYVLKIIAKKLAKTLQEKLVKILGAIRFVAKRRTTGKREYLTFIRQYVGIELKDGERVIILNENLL